MCGRVAWYRPCLKVDERDVDPFPESSGYGCEPLRRPTEYTQGEADNELRGKKGGGKVCFGNECARSTHKANVFHIGEEGINSDDCNRLPVG